MAVLTPEQVAANHWPVLTPVDGSQGIATVVLNRPVCVIGSRQGRVNLHLPSSQVSKVHALLVRSGPALYVRDLASTNHVYVNASPVKEWPLAEADVLRIGRFQFVCGAGFPSGGETQAAMPSSRVIHNGVTIPLQGRTLVIGARSTCDLVLDDQAASSVHAVVFERDGQFYLRDLGSEVGTFVDGNASRQFELRPGAEIRIGSTVVTFEFDPPDPAQLARGAMSDQRPELFDETADLLDAMPDTLAAIDDVTGVLAEGSGGNAEA